MSRVPELREKHSARVPKSLNRAVNRLAADEDTSLQESTIEALRLLLENRGCTVA